MASTICGWCGDRTHMAMVLDPHRLPRSEDWMAAFQCASETCQRLSIGWTALPGNTTSRVASVDLAVQSLKWEPTNVRRPDFPDVPTEIAGTASEAHACLSIGAAKGAVALARAVVEATAKAKGITERGIVGKIDALHSQGHISALTKDTSHQIREDGNSIAHGDIGDEAMTSDDAEAILRFMDALLHEVFQGPAALMRLKQRHVERKQGSGAAQQLPPAPSGGPAGGSPLRPTGQRT
ncbi:DUF4145 domain-containing protein [Streptomyces parvulus]|uniref:DUF4145 domain-containing protein n=1 Tax=Streptomyces parvulus TaxID=146923 RepID=UPI001E619B89|nr:DUF4145 domain-containing protein [Streptomyces parvulus]MCC9154889.1 DUF4145 domain-containing protein [Streptomyces parvulus]MCE7691266.1 DUF4145 domain-containing protein [Streptomyces parvulus]